MKQQPVVAVGVNRISTGAFIVEPFDKGNIEWLEAASAKGTE